MVVCFVFDRAGIACEVRRHPHLRDRPLALAGDGGVIRCVSPEGLTAGVIEGCDGATARSLCRGLVVLPYDREHYMDAMQTAWDAVAVETNTVEPVEPELCYAEFTGLDIVEQVCGVVCVLADLYGIPVPAGIGETKVLARAAAQRARRNTVDLGGVIEVTPGSELSFVSTLPIDTAGPLPAKLFQKFRNLGIRTLGDVGKVPKAELARQAGREWAHRLLRLCAGRDDDPVKPLWPRLYLESAIAFEVEIGDEGRIHAALRQCSDRVAAGLRSRYCRALTLTVELADCSCVSETETLANPACSPDQLFRAALRLLARLCLSQPILGIRLRADDIDSGGGLQLTLLDAGDSLAGYPHERSRSLDARVKVLRSKYGPQSVVPGGRMRRTRRIDCWMLPIGKVNDEQVTVATDEQGAPLCYRRVSGRPGRGGRDDREYRVSRVMDRWRSVEWSWGEVMESDCYRVETEPYGIYELHRLAGGWRLRGAYD